MGKNLIQQRRGRGTSTFRAPSFRYAGEVKHAKAAEGIRKARITDIIHSAGHSSPLAEVVFENMEKLLVFAPQGARVGDLIFYGEKVPLSAGNVMPLKSIPDGTGIHNIESFPGDGGKFVRASGTVARVVSKTGSAVIVQLPSKKQRIFNSECRASIGVIAGSGRLEKPLMKAGIVFHKRGAKNRFYPRTSGVAMNAVAHPYGGTSSSHKGRPGIARRFAPPGAKVGKLRPKRTGRRKVK